MPRTLSRLFAALVASMILPVTGWGPGTANTPARADAASVPRKTAPVARLVLGTQVGSVVMVSAANADREHYEMLAAIDPADSNHIMACTTVFSKTRNARSNIIYVSFDGGHSWAPKFEDSTTIFTGDPACTYGFGATAYYVGLPIYGGTHLTSGLSVYESEDSGKTWHFLTKRAFWDREYVTVDRTNSRYRGNVYLYGDGIERKNGKLIDGWDISRIVNGKLTPPVRSPESSRYGSMNATQGEIALDGTLVVPFEAFTGKGFELRVLRTTDGGATLSRSVLIGPECKPKASLASPTAIDQSSGPFRGRLYTAYNLDNGDHCSIGVVHSDDSGKTWSKTVLIHEDSHRLGFANSPNQTQPALAVNARGVLGLTWYDTRDDTKAKAYKLRFAASFDGGASFEPSVAVSTAVQDDNAQRPWFLGAYVGSGGASSSHDAGVDQPLQSIAGPDWMTQAETGDTRVLLVDASGVFHPFWYDNETGIMQLYTAPVAVGGRAWRNGDPSLDSFADITKRVTLRYTSTSFDPGTGTLTLAVAVVNRSDAAISGPLKMRLLWSESLAGVPSVADSDNGVSGPGAIWDFSAALGSGVLQPWTESHPVTLSFKLREIDRSNIRFPLLTFESRVYARGSR